MKDGDNIILDLGRLKRYRAGVEQHDGYCQGTMRQSKTGGYVLLHEVQDLLARFAKDELAGFTRRASPAAAVPEGALPPLPPLPPADVHDGDGGLLAGNTAYSARLMQAYARAAVEADRAQQGEPVYQIESSLKDGLHWRDTNKQVYDEHYPEHRRIVYRAATKAAAPADAEIAMLARKLVEFYPDSLPDLRCGDEPTMRKLVEACRATPVPDTGIPTAGNVALERAIDALDAVIARWDSPAGDVPEPVLLRIAAEQDYGDEDPKCIVRLCRAVEAEVASRCRAQGGMTKDNDNFRAPVSSTPTSGEVEKAPCCHCLGNGNCFQCYIVPAAPSHPSEAKAGDSVYTFEKPEGWVNLANPGQSWEEWTSEQGLPTTRGWKVGGAKAGEDA